MKKKHDHRLKLLRDNLAYFSQHDLKIKDKSGELVPFVFNQAQEYLDKRLNDQLAKTGKVRALIVKARQMGSSTYLEGRYYHKALWNDGRSVFILTHEAESTKKLFEMAKRFYDNTPLPIKPPIKNS